MKKKWGEYKVLLKGKGWWYKRLSFTGGSTSLQTHKNRDEIWVIYVPAGCKHQVGGKGDVFELAIGNPKERDIKRYTK
ncbi:MAG: hypothetical protein WC933_02635 [Candidatus Paceibacterota bacterium]|jgi:hypothetical protein